MPSLLLLTFLIKLCRNLPVSAADSDGQIHLNLFCRLPLPVEIGGQCLSTERQKVLEQYKRG